MSKKMTSEEMQAKLERIALLEKKAELREGLPHLYGQKFYPWARDFFESTNRNNFLVAANQIGKSSVNIRKCIHWATAPDLWPKLWRNKPIQFWYLMPTRTMCEVEWVTKWLPEFMPRGKYKDHPVYGWHEEKTKKEISSIRFNSGVIVYFKTYSQDTQSLQAGTVSAVFCFVAGTKIITKRGLQPIDALKSGDLVLSKDGWRSIVRTFSHEAEVITREFSNGERVTATTDHPFWTENRGWVRFGDLEPSDACRGIWLWKWIKKLSCLMESFTGGFQKAKTLDVETTTARPGQESNYTLPFGVPTTGKWYLKTASFITRILTHLITTFGILSCYRGLTTRLCTSAMNGGKRKSTHIHALPAERISFLEALKTQSRDTARKIAGRPVAWLSVQSVWLNSKLGWTRVRCSVVNPAEQGIERRVETVFNIEVEGSHTYFANGILTHNCDEELPEELFDEINMRRAATDGYFHLVFTATLGQELWRRTMEEKGEKEMFPDAFKRQVSMWDCLKFEDGTESHWSPSRIKRIERGCKSQAEVQRRVYGRFVKDEGLKYSGFDRTVNVKPVKPVPMDWLVYGGVDVGGGQGSHPSAITLVAVAPDYTEGRVIGGWRGDNVLTTAGDVLTKYFELTAGLNVTAAYYDYSAKDFSTIANRMGVSFNPANKSHDVGEQIINVLFRNEMMAIDDLDENISLVTELCTLGIDTPKTKARDDRVDSFRYAVSSIPWNFAKISEQRRVKLLTAHGPKMSHEEMGRRGLQMDQAGELDVFIDEEFEAFNELYEA